ncbi:hypothetical protein L0664_00260 [Octadecabacter sp. G9-8]|uniref:Transmembrane protein n=1 Tax=Octadecabacter dasysiphoniae TaxID=2909341 RepID=A0ABS9CRW7_9RHOB|nr:hypothetical protein [Octadecabacter dasysiphoniae]MCF2869482.1 hypothetical protein [Octadecabacter dasysiphoniae]
MTFNEAVATHAPAWVGIWLNIMLLGAIVLPLALFIWKSTRWTAVFTLIAGVVGVAGVMALYQQFGYVKLLGLPHIIVWSPLVIYLIHMLQSEELDRAPQIIIGIAIAAISTSLVFDYVDVLRYIAGERTPLAMPAA